MSKRGWLYRREYDPAQEIAIIAEIHRLRAESAASEYVTADGIRVYKVKGGWHGAWEWGAALADTAEQAEAAGREGRNRHRALMCVVLARGGSAVRRDQDGPRGGWMAGTQDIPAKDCGRR